MNFDNDPRLTAYALGEMTDAERLVFESELAAHPAEATAARSEIESIRALAAGLTSELKTEMETAPAISGDHRERGAYATKSRGVSRWILAAAASVVVGGLVFSIFAPSWNRAREVATSGQRFAYEPQATTMAPKSVASNGTVLNELYDKSKQSVSHAIVEDLFDVAKAKQTPGAGSGGALAQSLSTRAPIILEREVSSANFPTLATVDAAVTTKDAQLQVGRRPDETNAGYFRQPTDQSASSLGKDGPLSPLQVATRSDDSDKLAASLHYRFQDREATTFESYAAIHDNAFLDPHAAPLSTFGIDVDTASYSNVRRYLEANQRPPADAVRIEELINYFPTSDALPTDGKPFAVHMEVANCPWQPEHRLVRVALKGQEVAKDKRPPANLVFLIDVSGSMNEPNKLPLVKRSLRKLVGQLCEWDHVAIVVYAGNSGLSLPRTSAADKATILKAIDNLEAGGSTNGGEGIELAYATAMPRSADDRASPPPSNRVILCTDGDFNVGITDRSGLFEMIAQKAKAGIFLNVLGFGTGNVKDDTMEGLADKGNGMYGYIDSDREADKIFVEQVGGTLQTIAKDVKLQLEFNPATVKSYRLIGYENRVLKTEDFNNDLKDSGDMGAGHSVVALYEIDPQRQGRFSDPVTSPELKYQPATKTVEDKPAEDANTKELLTLKLRFKKPDAPLEQGTSELIETTLDDVMDAPIEKASVDMRFDASVAGFGMLLRESPHRASATWEMVRSLARSGVGDDVGGHRSEFLNLIDVAEKTR